MPTIVLENVTKFYKGDRKRGGKRQEIGVQDVNLTIRQGEFVFVIGSSGADRKSVV